MTATDSAAVQASEPNEFGYRQYDLGGFRFSRDEYFAHVAWPTGSHVTSIDNFLRALQRSRQLRPSCVSARAPGEGASFLVANQLGRFAGTRTKVSFSANDPLLASPIGEGCPGPRAPEQPLPERPMDVVALGRLRFRPDRRVALPANPAFGRTARCKACAAPITAHQKSPTRCWTCRRSASCSRPRCPTLPGFRRLTGGSKMIRLNRDFDGFALEGVP